MNIFYVKHLRLPEILKDCALSIQSKNGMFVKDLAIIHEMINNPNFNGEIDAIKYPYEMYEITNEDDPINLISKVFILKKMTNDMAFITMDGFMMNFFEDYLIQRKIQHEKIYIDYATKIEDQVKIFQNKFF